MTAVAGVWRGEAKPVMQSTGRPMFRTMKNPAVPGETRSRTWKVPVVAGNEEESPIWARRARQYWTLQERLYGLVMSNFTLAFDDYPETGPVITTFASVMAVLPGERRPDYRLPTEAMDAIRRME